MNKIWEKIVNVLNDQQIKDVLTGKASPVLKTENTIAVEDATLQKTGLYLGLGLVVQALVLGVCIFIGMRLALISVFGKKQ